MVAAGCVVLTALTGCSGLEGTGDKGYITRDGSVALIKAPDRGDPISLDGEDLDGDPLSLADLRGQVTVINVWWSGCPPCRKEVPELVEAAQQTKDSATFVGLNIRDASTAQAKSFVRTSGMPYPSFYSPDGVAMLSFRGTLTLSSVPSTVVLDRDGRVAATILGSIPSARTLIDVVEDVAADG
jgi:thiol-disulfide isomerase/thioredoxin